jgi:hypothetical protein
MCCGSAFLKRFFVFVLTFALGVSVSGFFIPRTPPAEFCPNVNSEPPPSKNQKFENAPILEQKNCVPVDVNLKYERLTAAEKPDFEAIKKDEKKKSLTAEEKTQKNSAASKQQFYSPSKDKAEVKDLLHREKCFDAQD